MSNSRPTRRHTSRRARFVNDARTPISGDLSDHGLRSHSVSQQRHVLFAHTNTTGTPAIGRSRTSTRGRPMPTPNTPHYGCQWPIASACGTVMSGHQKLPTGGQQIRHRDERFAWWIFEVRLLPTLTAYLAVLDSTDAPIGARRCEVTGRHYAPRVSAPPNGTWWIPACAALRRLSS